MLNVQLVVVLNCSTAVVHRRIADNAGGDRTKRADDDPEAIERKLRIFRDRTAPLIDYYRARGCVVHEIPVGSEMSGAELWELLQTRQLRSAGE
jgi:adenylate kinase family enzyme